MNTEFESEAHDQIAARKAIAELGNVVRERDSEKARALADDILMTFLNSHSDPLVKRIAAAWKRSAAQCGFNKRNVA